MYLKDLDLLKLGLDLNYVGSRTSGNGWSNRNLDGDLFGARANLKDLWI